MDDNLVTTEKILDTIKEWVSKKQLIPPDLWLDASAKLNVLAGDDEVRLAEMEFTLAQYRQKVATENPDRSMASVNTEVKANPLSRDIAILKAKIHRIDEFVRISKLQARMVNDAITRQ